MAQLQQSQAAINNQYGQMQAEDLANQKKQLAESQASMLEAYLQREQQKKINDWNSRVSSNIQSKNPTWVYTDTNGRLHYTNSQATAAAAKAQGYKVVENKKKNSSTKKSTTKNSTKSGLDYSSIWGNTGTTTKPSGTTTGTSKTKKSSNSTLPSLSYLTGLQNSTNRGKLSENFAKAALAAYGYKV